MSGWGPRRVGVALVGGPKESCRDLEGSGIGGAWCNHGMVGVVL